MKRLTLIVVPILLLTLFASFDSTLPLNSQKGPGGADLVRQDTFDMDAAIKAIKESIAGRENEPAETVFTNIQDFKGVPAGRLLLIMQMGFSRSLGVACDHCHNPEAWESEEKPQKQIAREMRKMTNSINEQLRNIPDLKSQPPVVNCTTCHRGQLKPATNLN